VWQLKKFAVTKIFFAINFLISVFSGCGCVVELIWDKNFIAGENFCDSFNQCRVSSAKTRFEEPNDCTVFRCVIITA